MEKQLQDLIAEVEVLKERVAVLEKQIGSAPIAPKPQLTEPLVKEQTTLLASQKKKLSDLPKSTGFSSLSEAKVAGTWFNRLGILAIMLAVAFFLKWSIDNRLIGELGRIVIGVITGLGFLGAGEYFQRRRFSVYGQGFSGGGIGILYFSIYAAFVFYHLIPQEMAFALMVLITLAASLLAVRYDSKAIGIIGIVGGFATPFLLSTGAGNRVVLYTYIGILDCGVLLVAYYKKWPFFNYLTFFLTYISFIAGLFSIKTPYYLRDFDTLSFSFLTLFFVIYFGISLMRHIVGKDRFLLSDTSLIVMNAVAYFALSYSLLIRHIPDWIGFWAVLLGLLYLAIGWAIYRRFPETKNQSLTLLAIAAGFITIAVPLQLDDNWIAIAWAAEAVILFYLTIKINPSKVPVPGFIVLALAIMALFAEPFEIRGDEFLIFLNEGAVAYLAVIAAMALILRLYQPHAVMDGPVNQRSLVRFLALGLNLLIIMFFTLETTAYFDYQHSFAQPETYYALLNTERLTLSLVWGLHAAVLVILGFWRRLKGIRLMGIAFLGIVILKVFLYDLSHLSTPNRIASFLVLGIILLAVSWLYQRYKHQITGGDSDEDRSQQ